MNIDIIPALPEQESVLSNLLELYVHDFSAFLDIQLDTNGRFGYQHLPLYWKESSRYPFLIKVNGHLAGFVFLHQGSQISGDESVWDVAEFFIVRGYRRRGIGMKVAHKVWNQFPGKWEVRVIDRNPAAKAFWSRAISDFLHKTIHPTPFKKNDEGWQVFSFKSKSIID